MKKLSLALATYNEESNIADCIVSCKGLVDEIVVVDGSSTDKTAEIALKLGATVIRTQNEKMFHINKQKAIEACTGDWILQLDADERITPELAGEIKKVLLMTDEEIDKYESGLNERALFKRHQSLVQSGSSHSTQSGAVAQLTSTEPSTLPSCKGPRLHTNASDLSNTYNAFFIPRLNYFLGGYLQYGGVYPDGVIRLIRKGKAYLPCKSVHELMEVEGKTGWLASPLIHKDSPTFDRYLARNNRYIDHLAEEINVQMDQRVTQNAKRKNNIQENVTRYTLHVALFFDCILVKPISTFFSLLIRHKGILDGWRGVVFAFFSAIRFARAYWRYLRQ